MVLYWAEASWRRDAEQSPWFLVWLWLPWEFTRTVSGNVRGQGHKGVLGNPELTAVRLEGPPALGALCSLLLSSLLSPLRSKAKWNTS